MIPGKGHRRRGEFYEEKTANAECVLNQLPQSARVVHPAGAPRDAAGYVPHRRPTQGPRGLRYFTPPSRVTKGHSGRSATDMPCAPPAELPFTVKKQKLREKSLLTKTQQQQTTVGRSTPEALVTEAGADGAFPRPLDADCSDVSPAQILSTLLTQNQLPAGHVVALEYLTDI